MGSKSLSIGVHYEPSGVDPHIGSAELALQMTNAVFDTMVHRLPDGTYLPGLAEHFDVSPDGCVYTFQLRRDVQFHDGTRFNASAVAYSLKRAHDPRNKSQLAGSMLGPYRGSRVIDEFTLQVELAAPYAMFLDALSQGWLAPVSPRAVEKLGPAFSRRPVGTGPFVFDRWVPGDRIVLKRNDAYRWGPPTVANDGPARIVEIVFVFLPDENKRSAALESGAVDAVFCLPPATATRLRHDERFIVETVPIRGVPVSLMMNTARAPTNDLRVRQAINFAIDQDALVNTVFGGQFARAYGPVSQFTLGYSESVEDRYPCDLDAARRLLNEAGWDSANREGVRTKCGERLRLRFHALPVNSYPEFGAIISEQLGKVGVEVEVVVLPPLDWIRAGKHGEHHLIPQGKYGSSSQLMGFVYHSRYSSEDGYGWSKRTASHHPGFDELLERGERTFDVEKFVPLYSEAQEIVMDEALIAPLHCNTNIFATRAGVRGIAFDAIGAYPLFHDADTNAVSDEGLLSDEDVATCASKTTDS